MNYERKVDVMDSLAGTQSFYEDADDSRRKRTRLIVAVVLIALALAAAWYAFSASKDGAAGADGAAAGGRHQPGARIVRHAHLRPSLQGRDQRLLRQLLRQAHVADLAGEGGDQAG